MKKFICLFGILSFLFVYTYSQTITNNATVAGYSELMHKSKKQKTAAWICLGGGLALFTTAIIIDVVYSPIIVISSIESGPQSLPVSGQILAIVGASAITTSIPLFVAASKNKHKAKLMLTNQKTAIGLPIAVPKNITSVTLSVPL